MIESIKQVLDSYSVKDLDFNGYKVIIGVNNDSSYKDGLIVHDGFAVIDNEGISYLFLMNVSDSGVVVSAFEGDYYDFILSNFDVGKVRSLGTDNVSLLLVNNLYSFLKPELVKKEDSNLVFNNSLKELDLSLRGLLLRK